MVRPNQGTVPTPPRLVTNFIDGDQWRAEATGWFAWLA